MCKLRKVKKIAHLLAAIPGASAYFKGSVVSYATQSKIEVLGINEKLIEENTVVSAAVAKQMVLAAKNIFKTDYAIATTGNAGPSKGDSDADLGVVFIAIATLMFSFANLGMPSYIYKFYPYYNDNLDKERNDILSWALLFSLIGFCFVAIGGIYFSDVVIRKFGYSHYLL